MWYVDTTELYAGVKINKIMTFWGKQRQQGNNCLKQGESGSERYILHVSSHTWSLNLSFICVYIHACIYMCVLIVHKTRKGDHRAIFREVEKWSRKRDRVVAK